MTLRSALLLAGALGAVPSALRAQSVQGQVLDAATRRPLAGLAVRLLRASRDSVAPVDTTALAQTVTAGDGVFALTAPDSGAYRVRIGAQFLGPVLTLTRDADDQRVYIVPAAAGAPSGVFGADAVDTTAKLVLGGVQLRYPPRLVQGRVQGAVLLRLVVDTSGAVEPGSVTVVHASRPEFRDAALTGLRNARFKPAVREGRRVRQAIDVPVTFALGEPPRRADGSERTRNPNEIEVRAVAAVRVGQPWP